MDLPPDIAIRWMTDAPGEPERLEGLLSPGERARVETFGHAGRRREFILGRAALRTLLAERLGTAPGEVPLVVAPDGGVEVEGADDLHLSIAHSGPHAVAAVGARRLGVDLERIAPRHPDLARFLLHPEERAYFDALPLDHTRSCILYWTLKEATLKALRTGFRTSPKKLRLDVDVGARRTVARVEGGPVLHARFEERDAFMMAVAYVP
ncbi:MAG: 4'-phosphopantetheinyl transferase superfamily protein [Rhodothermales bacterium]|nr:4'-phosphopantetheinyl transferase superfamily protein [Rhodothermales bacterium]